MQKVTEIRSGKTVRDVREEEYRRDHLITRKLKPQGLVIYNLNSENCNTLEQMALSRREDRLLSSQLFPEQHNVA